MKNGHLIKSECLARSKRWRKIPDETTRWVYCMLIGAVDSWGMLPADSRTLESTLAPFTTHTGQVLTESVLVLAEIGLLRYWSHQGDPWIYLEGHETNQRLSKRKKNPDVPLPTKSGPLPARNGVVPGRKPYDVDFDSDLDTDLDIEGTDSALSQSSPPLKQKAPKTPEVNPGDEQTFLDLRDYHANLHGLHQASRGFTNHSNIFWRVVEALKTYSVDDCRQIIRGHKKLNEKAIYSGLRFAFKAASKENRKDIDHDMIATYHKAGGKERHNLPRDTSLTSDQLRAKNAAEEEARRNDPKAQAALDDAKRRLEALKAGGM